MVAETFLQRFYFIRYHGLSWRLSWTLFSQGESQLLPFNEQRQYIVNLTASHVYAIQERPIY